MPAPAYRGTLQHNLEKSVQLAVGVSTEAQESSESSTSSNSEAEEGAKGRTFRTSVIDNSRSQHAENDFSPCEQAVSKQQFFIWIKMAVDEIDNIDPARNNICGIAKLFIQWSYQ